MAGPDSTMEQKEKQWDKRRDYGSTVMACVDERDQVSRTHVRKAGEVCRQAPRT